ncbi:MAG: DUF378 domain-containing protein [Eubacterium sp.]|jgi:uncharacterized membrane protein YuzA (DUF378 family)|nr:DUF378 domain-containing protein [Eubacterium sp.]
MNTRALDYTLLTLVIIGAINWGLTGLFHFDLIAWIFGSYTWWARIIYLIIGIAGILLISLYGRIRSATQ